MHGPGRGWPDGFFFLLGDHFIGDGAIVRFGVVDGGRRGRCFRLLGGWRYCGGNGGSSGQDHAAQRKAEQNQRGQSDQQSRRAVRDHPPDEAIAHQQMMAQRARDMEQYERDAEPGDQAVTTLGQAMRGRGQRQMGQGDDPED